MKVRDLMSQENWPFENAIAGVAMREDFVDHDEEGENENDEAGTERRYEKGTAPNDVFIVDTPRRCGGQRW